MVTEYPFTSLRRGERVSVGNVADGKIIIKYILRIYPILFIIVKLKFKFFDFLVLIKNKSSKF
jgi:hypothetical protein